METVNTSAFNAALIDLIHQVVEQELKDRETPTIDITDYEYEIRDMISETINSASISIDV
jgi:hypothetical protein